MFLNRFTANKNNLDREKIVILCILIITCVLHDFLDQSLRLTARGRPSPELPPTLTKILVICIA